ncbi:alpha/beta hydrolase [Tistrella mobilis]|jgi:proline iminopeptidase|uniref:alpha/beta fold hydrolase n=1 Tax=Tistrella mobilis TaxID=171437 RepID=UPI003557C475
MAAIPVFSTADLGHVSIAHTLLPAGRPGGMPVVFVHGLSMQGPEWPEAFLDDLGADHPVLLLDNRDAGLSTAFGPVVLGEPGASPPQAYDLFDMARDVVALLDRLGLDRVHLVGYSMGGRITQIIAATEQSRVASLTCLSSTGGRRQVEAKAEVRDALGAARAERLLHEPDIELFVAQSRLLDGTALQASDDEHRRRITRAVARSYRPLGTGRQMAAIESTMDRRELLGQIICPTLFIHGTADPVVALDRVREGVERISGARLHVIQGLGHLITEAATPLFLAPLAAHIRAADARG